MGDIIKVQQWFLCCCTAKWLFISIV